jgi:hypothetical protein
MAATGIRPIPSDVTSNAYAPNAISATAPTPTTSLSSPNSATPTTYSSSDIGVTIRPSRLRDQVSSRNPVASAICAW